MALDFTNMLNLLTSPGAGPPGLTGPLRRAVEHRLAGDMRKAVAEAQIAYDVAHANPAHAIWKPVTENILAWLYKATADYRAAIKLYENAYEGMVETDGAKSREAEVALRGLADVYHKAGYYDKAHDACMRALELTRGVRPREYAFGCQLLARIRSEIGDYTGALEVNREAHAILVKNKDASSEDALLYAANISQEATYLVHLGDIDNGIALQLDALALRRAHLPANHLVIAESLGHLGRAEISAQRPYNARIYLREVLDIHDRNGDNTDKMRHDNDRLIYSYADFLLGNVESAEREVTSVLARARERFGDHHPVTIAAVIELAMHRAAAGNPADALALLSDAVDGQNLRIGPVFTTRSDRQRLEYVSTLYQARDLALTVLVDNPGLGSEAVGTVLRMVAQRCGLTLDATVHRHQTVLSGNYPEHAQDIKRLQEVDEALAGLAFDQELPSFEAVESWERERDELQTRLAAGIPELRRDHDLVTATAGRLADALPENSVLLQFVRFSYREKYRQRALDRYGAFVLPAGDPGSVRFADLGPAEDLDHRVEEYREVITPGAGRARISAPVARTDWRPLAAKLYLAVIEPLKPPAGARLVVVPDGRLHHVPFASLIGPQGEPLVASTVITHLGSPRDLLLTRSSTKDGPALVIAAPDYGNGPRPALGTLFEPLPGSADEGAKVAALLGTRALTGPDARKNALTSAKSPALVHIATHGFAIEGPIGSGLAFAGANLPGNDGILTTADVAHLDLTGTRLVVLSACDTGLGTIQAAEGVFGLYRAFTIAGAQSVVTTLWSIPDRATAQLMTSFYKALQETIDPAVALARTQAAFADRHVREWGAFTCHGGLPPRGAKS